MASRYKGYWKCDYRHIDNNPGLSRSWTEYYYVQTSAEWYYFDMHKRKWTRSTISFGTERHWTFRRHMGYNMDPYINKDGDRTFRKIPPLEIVLVCGLCKRSRNGKRVSSSSKRGSKGSQSKK